MSSRTYQQSSVPNAVAAERDPRNRLVSHYPRRRLEAEGTSYQQLKDRLRSDLAIDRLVSSQASIDELALELGFHDASAFHRAFRRWTGLPPGAYRRREQGEPERESR